MNPRWYAILAALLCASLFVRGGIQAWPVLLGALLLLAVPWFLDTRPRASKPSRLEWLIAGLWIAFRVVGCFTVAAFCLLLAYYAVFRNPSGTDSWQAVLVAAVSVCMAIAVAAVGAFGYGGQYYGDNAGAAERHRRNRERYRLRRRGQDEDA